MAIHSSILARRIPGTGEPVWAAVYGVAMSWTQLSDFTFIFPFNALEKEMATHSSVLAWRIPGTGEPVGLRWMGSHRVGHDCRDLAAAAAAASKKNTFESVLMKWMKLEPIILSEVSQKEKHQYSILMHIYGI